MKRNQVFDINNIKYTKNVLINGSVQSGKTNIIIQLAFKSYELGYDVIILVNNFYMDLKQIEYRINNFIVENKKDKKTVCILNKKITNKSFNKQAVYVSMCNSTRVAAINDFYKPKREFVIIIDESDIFNQDSHKTANYSLNNVSFNLLTLFTKAKSIIRMTATSFSHIYVNDMFPLRTSDIYYTDNGPNYISFGHEKFKLIPFDRINEGTSDEQTSDEVASAASNDEQTSDVRMYLSRSEVAFSAKNEEHFIKIINEDIEYFSSVGILPFIVVNVSPTIANHNYLKDIVQENFAETTVVLVNEGTVKVYYPGTDSEIREFDSIQDSLSYIQLERESVFFPQVGTIYFSSFPHKSLVMITCKQLGRGISTRSQTLFFNDISNIIYATSIVFDCSEKKSLDEVIQGALRIGGQFPGYEKINGFELRLHTSTEIINSIKNQMNWIDSIKESILSDNKNLKVTEVITPLIEKPERAPISKTRGTFVIKKVNDVYECTEDKINIATEKLTRLFLGDFKNKEFKDLSWIDRIKKVISIENKAMTIDEIAKKGTDINAWEGLTIENGQLHKSLSTILFRAIESKDIKRSTRKNEGVFEYSLKEIIDFLLM